MFRNKKKKKKKSELELLCGLILGYWVHVLLTFMRDHMIIDYYLDSLMSTVYQTSRIVIVLLIS